jgi:dihydroorotase
MNLLLKRATIIDKNSVYNNQQMDIHLIDGRIASIEKEIKNTTNATEISAHNLHVSNGWIDVNCNVKEPGFEHKETLTTVCNAAAQGGFTAIAAMPTTHPITDSKANVHYIINATAQHAVSVLPIGAITQQREGKHLAELYDMQQAGAVAFSDGKRTITDAGLVTRALQYMQPFGGKLMLYNDDKNISLKAQANEGTVATTIGLKGAPALAEHIMVQRNIMLAEYNNAPVHLCNISSAGSIALINIATAKGIHITCDVAAHYFMLDDSTLEGFDSNYKFQPPVRNSSNKAELITALLNNSITAIGSDHTPEPIEDKNVEFENAAYGIIGLETAFSVARSATQTQVPINTLIHAFTYGPAQVLGIILAPIAVGTMANITLFDPTLNYTFAPQHIHSLSSNTPFVNTQFTGKALGIITKNTYVKSK